MSLAVITGASRGLGRALALALAERNWRLVVDARDATALHQTSDALLAAGAAEVHAVSGDVTDPAHRDRLLAVVTEAGGPDLLVNNASTLGASPMPALDRLSPSTLEHIYAVNVVAPLALVQVFLPALRERSGKIVNVTSDAAAEPYAGWGGYGSAKAALDQLSAILAVEQPGLGVYAFDPGDMRTRMHQEAFPGEDISDRPLPESVVPALLRLVEGRLPSGRYRAAELRDEVAA